MSSDHSRDVWALAALVLLPLPLRAWLAARVGLAPDEAYYWGWSQALAAGYTDHPPAVAWLIRAGTELAGDGELAIRAPALVLGGVLLPLAIYWLAREVGVGQRVALLMPVAALIQPLGVAAGLLITPDVPLLVSWTLCAAALTRALRTGVAWPWLAAGIALGVALLSKHSGWLLLASAAIGIWLEPGAARQLRRPWPWIGLGLALLTVAPNLWWDAARGFPSLGFQLGHGLGPEAPYRAPLRLLELIGGQVGLLTPIVALGCWRFLRRRAIAPLLWAMALVPLSVFGAASLLAQPEANWPAPAHPLLLVGAALWLERELKAAPDLPHRRRLRAWTIAAISTSALLTGLALLHLLRPLPLFPPEGEPVTRLRGWRDLPVWLADVEEIAVEDYELGAALRYHLPRHPDVLDASRLDERLSDMILVVSAPGESTPALPSWVRPSGCQVHDLSLHPMQRADGAVVRTLGGFRLSGCGERSNSEPYGLQRRPVSQSTWWRSTPLGEMSITAKVMGRAKRLGPREPGLSTAIPWSVPIQGMWEWPHTTKSAPWAWAMVRTSRWSLVRAMAIWVNSTVRTVPRAEVNPRVMKS
jgi:4-amino-4-deoxy-L-arabinose transferase-like glycosyltransferase